MANCEILWKINHWGGHCKVYGIQVEETKAMLSLSLTNFRSKGFVEVHGKC